VAYGAAVRARFVELAGGEAGEVVLEKGALGLGLVERPAGASESGVRERLARSDLVLEVLLGADGADAVERVRGVG
jgi:hypothetical protein